jgi:hypothetical protein
MDDWNDKQQKQQHEELEGIKAFLAQQGPDRMREAMRATVTKDDVRRVWQALQAVQGSSNYCDAQDARHLVEEYREAVEKYLNAEEAP